MKKNLIQSLKWYFLGVSFLVPVVTFSTGRPLLVMRSPFEVYLMSPHRNTFCPQPQFLVINYDKTCVKEFVT